MMKTNLYNCSYLSIVSWNVQGIRSLEMNKMNDPLFLKEIEKHHIIGLCETHSDANTHINVDGFSAFQINRDKSGKKSHGGIAILVRKEISSGVKFLKARTNDMAWVCLKKDFFHTKNDIYMAMIYISPANSTYTKQLEYDVFEVIEDEIAKYSSKGQVLIMGDLNSRTSTVKDFIDSKNAHYIPTSFSFNEDCKYVDRSSQDCKIVQCTFGKQLIDLCISASLKIVNGRMLGDSTGKYTCHKYNGSSVVDYVIADHTTFAQIRYFRVHDLVGSLSDHCKVSFGLAVSVSASMLSVDKPQLKPVPCKFVWDNGIRSEKFTQILSNEQNLKILNDTENMLDGDGTNIDNVVLTLNKMLTDTATVSLKKVKRNPRKQSKRWYNKSCSTLKAQVNSLAKQLSKDPKNSYIRGLFSTTKKQYKKSVKHAKYTFKQCLAEKLESAYEKDPKAYWKLLEALKQSENDTQTNDTSISPDDWTTHFRSLFSQHPLNNSEQEKEILKELEQRENEKIFNELSFKITNDEIKNAAKHLKSGKKAQIAYPMK